MTAISNRITNPYIGKEALSYIRAGITKRISRAIPNAVRIHTNCFPLRHEKSKIEAGSDAWMDA